MSDSYSISFNAEDEAGVGDNSTPGSGGGAAVEPGLLSFTTQGSQARPLFNWADTAHERNRAGLMVIKPFGDNPPPTTLTPNMLVLTPFLEKKHPNIFTPEAFKQGMDKYAPSWGLDRETLLRQVGNRAGDQQEDQPQVSTTPQNQESAKQPDESFDHGGVGYYRKGGQLYMVNPEDPTTGITVLPETEAKILKERGETKGIRYDQVEPWEENAVASSQRTDFEEEMSKGFNAPAGDGAYDGKSLPYAIGRGLGEWTPWDEYRRFDNALEKVRGKARNNEEIQDGDVYELGMAGGKFGVSLAELVGTLKGVRIGGKALIKLMK